VVLPGFDYKARAEGQFEVPLAERIAAIRAKKVEDRARADAKAARRKAAEAGGPARSAPPRRRPR
jgi:ATP-dependent RNA helicase RhlE